MSECIWIFAYGSLIWDPGFIPQEQVVARLDGWHRRFCLRSLRYRGTFTEPGLVLALDAGLQSYCEGVALSIPHAETEPVMAMIRARELFNPAYREITASLQLQDGRVVQALTYVVNRDHEQYGDFTPEQQAQMISTAEGERGPNVDYLLNTADHLKTQGIADPMLDRLAVRVRELKRELT
ncbi:MAG: gamma-glutamylcyclotransferase [Paracoccaceae bacterium]|uniref:gamma-glutamylcyclotransferase n=1 Tax=Pseudomonadota TaxID=1224 RepID=UPI00329835A7